MVTVTVIDDDNTSATDTDDATVTINPADVISQTLTNVPTVTTPETPTTTTTTTTTLPKTGADVTAMLAVALGLLAVGGLLLLAGTRWVPSGQLSSLLVAGGMLSTSAGRWSSRWSRQRST